MPWISAHSILSFAKETTVGTAPARSGSTYGNVFGITNRDVNLPDRQIQANPLPSFGMGRKYAQVIKGPYGYVGSVPFLPLNGAPIYWAMGEDTYDGVSGVHTVTTRDSFGLPSVSLLALMRSHDDSVIQPFQRVFPGTACSSMSLSAQAGGPLQAEAGIMAFKPEDWNTVTTTAGQHVPSSFTPDVESVRPYQWFDVASSSDVMMGTVSIARLEEFSLRVDNRLQPKHYFGSDQEPTEYITRLPQFTFSGRMVPNAVSGTSDQIYSLLMDGNPVDFSVKLTRGANDYIKLIVEDAMITQSPKGLRADGEEVVASFQLQPRNIKFEINDDVDADYATGWS